MSNYEDEMTAAPISDDEELDLDFEKGAKAFVVPNGKHAMVCVDAVKGKSKAGNDMITWSFRAGASANNLEFKTWTVLSDAALWKLDEVMTALGLKKKGDQKSKLKLRDAIGRQVLGLTKKETKDNRTRSVLDSILPHPEGPVKNASPDDEPSFP